MLRRKSLRFLSCLFSVFLFFGTFGVGAFAGSDDSSFVEDTDLRNWTVSPGLEDCGDLKFHSNIYCIHTIGDIIGGNKSTRLHLYSKFTETSVRADSSYTVKFSFPSYSVFKKIYVPNFDEEWYLNQFTADSNDFQGLSIGLGYLDSSGDFVYYDDYTYTFSKNDIVSSFDDEFTWSFTLKDFKGKTPYFGISVLTVSPYVNHYFYFYQPEFIDESQAEEDGFFSRLFQWFEDKFEDLKEWFKSLFIPSDEALTDFKDKVNDFFEEKLGFVYTAINFVKDLYSTLVDVLKSGAISSTYQFTLKSLSFEFLGYNIKLWDDITLSFDFLEKIQGISLMYSIYKASLHVTFILSLVYYADKIYKEVLRS